MSAIDFSIRHRLVFGQLSFSSAVLHAANNATVSRPRPGRLPAAQRAHLIEVFAWTMIAILAGLHTGAVDVLGAIDIATAKRASKAGLGIPLAGLDLLMWGVPFGDCPVCCRYALEKASTRLIL